MRLQLSIAFMFAVVFASAQVKPEEVQQNIVTEGVAEKVEVDFLLSYYHQDGNNSAVTGGTGTENLTDRVSNIIVNVPIRPLHSLNVNYGVSYYTSASSDNINPYTISSASSYNVVNHLNITTTKSDTTNNAKYGLLFGGFLQNNFWSYNVGGFYAKSSSNNNREVKVQGSYSLDKWGLTYAVSNLYPVELKGKGDLVDTDKRHSYNVSLAYKQVLTKRMQMQLAGEFIYQRGLLSTPFHRVYFQDQVIAKLERLPGHRWRLPLTARLNYFMLDKLIIRSLYRFYLDDFGIYAHTINLELPYKITNFFSLYPFCNYHIQTAATYFKTYKQHALNEQYYTSDYDLSNLSSYEIGGGFYYAPVSNITLLRFGRKNSRAFLLKKWETRYGYYKRSTGLHASIISTQFSFIF